MIWTIPAVLAELQQTGLEARQQGLRWVPHSVYQLRDLDLVGEILAVSDACLTGRIIRSADIVWINDQLNVPASSPIETAQWDLRGNNETSPSYDLMTLIRRPVW